MRNNWIYYLERIVSPVLSAAANDSLKAKMPIYGEISQYQYLEAIGRIVCGISPWLNLPQDGSEESILRNKYKILTIDAISNLVNPESSDFVDFSNGSQSLVDTAYLTQGLLRAPNLWNDIDPRVQQDILAQVKKTRKFKPPKNNWLLFASMIEAFLLEYDGECNKKRLFNGVRQFIYKFYSGDGMYGDGYDLSIDYYNSYVIQPMLIDTLNTIKRKELKNSDKYLKKCIPRYKRFIKIQERMISPEGAYPLFGRTLICRFGAFNALAQSALLDLLPESIAPAQVRCALNAVLERQMKTLGNFDSDGFLTIGFNGLQKEMAESYVSSGSPYHCCTVFLPLGLNSDHGFWIDGDEKWTSLKAFDGDEFNLDHAYHEESIRLKIEIIEYKIRSVFTKLKLFRKND